MIALTEYDDFGVLNGHAIIGDWIAFQWEGELRTGRITSVEKTGVTREGLIPSRQDCMVIDEGKYRLIPVDDDWYRYGVVKIACACCTREKKYTRYTCYCCS